MSVQDLIIKKRDGAEHSEEEIQYLVRGMSDGSIPDYQLSAWAMAVFFRGMSPRETRMLALAMAHSGEMVDLSSVPGWKVDKHSTGGVGDKTTPIVLALCASAGLVVAKMAGRGLGHTGGTVDKFESIPGFRSSLSSQEFILQLQRVGAALVSQSGNMVPADKRLYALRDLSGTVESIPLIASSIMSKKIAAGADIIVLDVKCGSGAFMSDLKQARDLARTMVEIGQGLGRRVAAVISDMNEPLGRSVGNSLEIIEALEVMQGRGPDDLRDLSLNLAVQMMVLAGWSQSEARAELAEKLQNGTVLAKFIEFIEIQGGKIKINVEGYNLEVAPESFEVIATEAGWVSAINAREIGELSMHLGAGRTRVDEAIDHSVGIVLDKKVGDYVEPGERLAVLYTRPGENQELMAAKLAAAYRLSSERIEAKKLVLEIIS